jgi:hypothetical protein
MAMFEQERNKDEAGCGYFIILSEENSGEETNKKVTVSPKY